MWSVRGIGVAVSVSDVDVGAQRLQPLLVLDAEALLLVDDDEAEVVEHDVLRQEPVRPDDDVDGAVGQPREDLPRPPPACGSARAPGPSSG